MKNEKSYEELPSAQHSYCYWMKGLTVVLAERHLNSLGDLNLTTEEYGTIALMIDLTLDNIASQREAKESFEEKLDKHYGAK